MGKISREKMTGLTETERKNRAKRRNPIRYTINKYKHLFKRYGDKSGLANNSRDGKNDRR